MKRIAFVLVFVLIATSLFAQKSRVLSVLQMIDKGKYSEGKEAIELAVWNEKTSSWARTYYVRGLLCQTAYEDGFEDNDIKKTRLYPDQLYLAYSSYEKAIELDVRKRLQTAISQKYYLLSNDFRKLGQRYFKAKEYEEALRAFEYALLVNNSDLIPAKVDTSLVYNIALAAYESENWDKSTPYLSGLHESGYSAHISLLLYQAHLELGDSARAEEVLFEAVEIFNYDYQVVVYLINLFVKNSQYEQALQILKEAILQHPENHRLLWGEGLIYRRMGEAEKAIVSFKQALEMAPDEPKIYYHIGVVYYNMGIDLTEKSLKLEDAAQYRKMKELARDRYTEAIIWLELSYEMDPYSAKTISRLHQLYFHLQMKEKEELMRMLIE